MADFQSSLKANEIEEVLTGALLYTKAQPLTEGEKAFVRGKIGATELGEGIKIISHFDSLDELKAAVPSPKAGDAYSVGSSLPYSLYVYDFYHESWVDHGVIRANDITARFAQNITVGVGAWEEDTNVFVDYSYKAAISLGEVTGNDFPIVAFSPSDAVGGNFCPVCYAFDGYVEIWAKAVPAAAISIPAITFIVQSGGANGNNTKGITNAGGGVATGGIGTAQIADKSITANKVAEAARTKNFNVTIPDDWEGETAPYSRSLAVEGILATDMPKVFFYAPNDFANLEAQQEAFAMLYSVDSANGVVTFYAKEKPTVEFSVLIEVSRI